MRLKEIESLLLATITNPSLTLNRQSLIADHLSPITYRQSKPPPENDFRIFLPRDTIAVMRINVSGIGSGQIPGLLKAFEIHILHRQAQPVGDLYMLEFHADLKAFKERVLHAQRGDGSAIL